MNIIVLHGDDNLKSQLRLDKFILTAKNRGWEVIRIDYGQKLNLSETLSSSSLFVKERLFCVNDGLKLTKLDLKWLGTKSKNFSGTLIIYSDSTIPKVVLSSLPNNIKIEEFKLPKQIFKFADSFYPGNTKPCLKLLHEIVKKEPIEFVFSLLARQIRDLYWVTVNAKTLSYPSWRISKLKGQSVRFTQDNLGKIVSLLAEADIKAKTSQTSLIDSLDQIIITQLK